MHQRGHGPAPPAILARTPARPPRHAYHAGTYALVRIPWHAAWGWPRGARGGHIRVHIYGIYTNFNWCPRVPTWLAICLVQN